MSMEIQTRKADATDLTDEQWAIVEPLMSAAKTRHGGRPRTICLREVVNTILSLNRTGCQWEMLPHDLLPKSSAYDGGKKIKGRKRHLLVDTLGLLIAVLVTGANVDDGSAAPGLPGTVFASQFPGLQTIFGDNKHHNKKLDQWLTEQRPGWSVEVKMRPKDSPGFTPVKKR